MDEELKEILNDKTSGSTDILYKVKDIIKKNTGNEKKLNEILTILKSELIHFSAIRSYVDQVEKAISKGHLDKTFFNSISTPLPVNDIYNSAKPFLSKIINVLTVSNSRMVIELIKLMYRDNIKLKVTAPESRPNFEGRILASALLNENIPVQLITDAQLGMFIPACDAVLCGADMILGNGSAVNKTGSLAAAVLCRHFNKPFYIIAQKEKFTDDINFTPKEEHPGEIWDMKHPNLQISNIYFEVIDADLITKILTDN